MKKYKIRRDCFDKNKQNKNQNSVMITKVCTLNVNSNKKVSGPWLVKSSLELGWDFFPGWAVIFSSDAIASKAF
jgi:hypothetical protein